MTHTWLDATTAAVLGTAAIIDLVRPEGAKARQLFAHRRPFLPGGEQAWRDEILAAQTCDAWWEECAPKTREAIRQGLADLPDVSAALRRLRAQGAPLDDAHFFAIKRFCYIALHELFPSIQASGVAADEVLHTWHTDLTDLIEHLHPEASPTPRFALSGEHDEALADARRAQRALRRTLRERRAEVEQALRDDYPSIAFPFSGNITYADPDDATRSEGDPRLERQGDRRILSDELLRDTQRQLDEGQRHIDALESALRVRLSDMLRPRIALLEEVEQALATLDNRLAKVRWRRAIHGTWPTLSEDAEVVLRAGFDPRHVSPQPINFDLPASRAPVVVTGPNMGGKSALLKTLGLCQWCLQHALPVPAQRYCAPLMHHVVYVGADAPGAHEQMAGLSSFGREIRRIVAHRQEATAPALWLLDEVGRGTHPEEGAHLATEILLALRDDGHATVAATHFPALAAHPDMVRWRITGLGERDELAALLAGTDADDSAALEAALREAMDYAPTRLGEDEDVRDVPRDARLIASLLGWRRGAQDT